MKSRVVKKLTAVALSAALMVTGTTMAVNAQSMENNIATLENEDLEASAAVYSTGFELQYVDSRAPLGANYPEKTFTFTASGKDHISLWCTYFNQQITNYGYLTQESGLINPVPIYNAGSYNIRYSGASIPRQGVRISIKLLLKNYSNSNPMCVRGNIE